MWSASENGCRSSETNRKVRAISFSSDGFHLVAW